MTFVDFKKCCTDVKQFIRLVVLVACICVSGYQLAECFRKIQYPPISTHYGFHLNETLRYPAVTICRNPPYKTQVFEKYGFQTTEITYATAWKHFKYDEYTLQDFFEEATYAFEESIAIAALDKWPKNVIVTSSFALTYGRCFTITPRNESKSWGTDYGYFFYFTHTDMKKRNNKHDEGYFAPDLAGFHIFIENEHEKFTEKSQQADIFKEYMYVEAGDAWQVNLKINQYNQVPTSRQECNPDINYSKSRCVEDGMNKMMSERVGCSTPWIPNLNLPTCGTYNQTKKMVEFTTVSEHLDYFYKSTDCPIICNATTYSPFVQSVRTVPLPDCTLKIYFSSNLYTLMEEVMGYDWNVFLSDLGGSLGFLLGLSVLGTICLVEQLIGVIIEIKNRKRNAEEESNNEMENNCGLSKEESSARSNDDKKTGTDDTKKEFSNYLRERRSCEKY